ncbi:Protein phosphatase 2C [Giardia duodenalis]|uniref:Protein phosphatase 2C n=1 Tax=Giardia intestinalis TaxID=5741 RepID=V6TV51_GIAIN|nr:Protein phosphatase 2C [Giardia intestinalis]
MALVKQGNLKQAHMFLSSLYVWGHGSVSGRRPSNEDAHIIRDLKGLRQDLIDSITFVGVFDGHGGDRASKFVRDKLHLQLSKVRIFPMDLKESLRQAYLNTDKLYLREEGTSDIYSSAGTTAVVCIHHKGMLYFANAGDSRAIVGLRDRGVRQITVDHKPNLPAEKTRIERAGSCVVMDDGDCPRVAGMLAVSRAIGDSPFKNCGVIADPDIFALREADADYIVLACDGLWDVLSNEDVDNLIRHVFVIAGKSTDPVFATQLIKSKLSGPDHTATRKELLQHAIACLVASSGPDDQLVKIATRIGEYLSQRQTSIQELATVFPEMPGLSSLECGEYKECDHSYKTVGQKISPEAVASYLLRLALCLGSEDNVTIVLGLGRKLYPKSIIVEYDSVMHPQ